MFDPTLTKARKQIWGLLTNKWALGCFGILTIQQCIEASATFWLVGLMNNIASGQPFMHYLSFYLVTLVLPYIPWCFAFILKTTWKQEAERSFINAFVSSNKSRITEWGDKQLKEEKLSILTAEGPSAINALIDYAFDLYSYVMYVMLNIFALSLIVEPFFAIGYAISVTIVIAVMRIQRTRQRQLTQQAVTAHLQLSQSLLASWDNVLLGNQYNFERWDQETSQRLNLSLQRHVDLERFNQFLAICTALITTIPALCVVVYYVVNHWEDRVYLSSLVVALPLLFQILSYTYQTLALAFKWTMHRSKLTAIYRAIQQSKDAPGPQESKVQWSRIAFARSSNGEKNGACLVMPQNIYSTETLLEQALTSGRITLRGENGTGKSTALMLIKKALRERSFFLPTHTQLSFEADVSGVSTGESLRSRLMEILERVDADIILLDDWDANLDRENQRKLSNLIDALAEKKCVIEVRNR